MPPVVEFPPVVRKSGFAPICDLLGVRTGDTLMLHASVKTIGRVGGGPGMVLESHLGR